MPKKTGRKPTTPEVDTGGDWERWVRSVQIREVAVDSVEFHVNRERLSVGPPPTVNAQYRLGPASDSLTPGQLRLGFEFEVLMTEHGGTAKPEDAVIRVKMTYHALYTVPEREKINEEHVKCFKERIASAHVFPFVRAHFADLLMRAGLPPLYLPLAQPGAARPGEATRPTRRRRRATARP